MAFMDAMESLLHDDEIKFQMLLEKLRYDLSCTARIKHCDTSNPGHIEMIRDILMVYPSFASTPRVSDGAYPLHIAALIGDLHLGCVIASAYPAASAAQSMKGKTPLHIAAREGHVDFVEMLLRLNPSTAQISTKKLKLPLHFAAGEGLADVCKQLLRVFPQGATQRSTKGKLPLHLASRKGSVETMQALLSVYPQGSESLDWEYATPINLAVRDGQEDVAQHLIDEFPLSLKVRNMSGDLPLDIAIRNSTSLRLFTKIVKAWPEGCRCLLANVRRDENTEFWEWNKIELCLQAVSGWFDDNKSQSPLPNSREYLPLHMILELTSNESLINRVLRLSHDLVRRKDGFGRLPLHIACEHSDIGSGAIVEQLVMLYPQASLEKDSTGRLPLHIALAKKLSLSAIKALLTANPKSAIDKCTFDPNLKNCLPLLFAVECDCSVDISYTLARLNPNLFSSEED
jgi:ankyrin repeat protein